MRSLPLIFKKNSLFFENFMWVLYLHYSPPISPPIPRFLLKFLASYSLSIIVTYIESCKYFMLSSFNVNYMYLGLTFWNSISLIRLISLSQQPLISCSLEKFKLKLCCSFMLPLLIAKINKKKNQTINVGEDVRKGTLT